MQFPAPIKLVLVLAVLATACHSQSEEKQAPAVPQAPPAQPAQDPAADSPAPLAAAPTPSKSEIVAQARNAVVLVRTSQTRGVGFLIEPHGIVATNYQLIKGATVVGVKLGSGDIYPATEIVARDPLKNLALIRISGFKLPVLELGDSTSVQAGQDIIIVTDPAGAGTMISGTVAAVADISEIDNQRKGHKLIRVEAALPSGSEGAPVLDTQGKVIGLLASYGSGELKQPVAVPSNYIAGLSNNPQPVALSPAGTEAGNLEQHADAGTQASIPAQTNPASDLFKPPAPAPRAPKPAPPPPRYTQSVREIQRIYVAVADNGKLHRDRKAGPAICKPKFEDALRDEDFRIAPSSAKADVVLSLSGTHEWGCTPLGCGREIMRYRAKVINKEGEVIWHASGEENAIGFDEVCEDMAEDVAEAMSEARDR